jgi:purine-binding chemotaxis protein CheW
MATDLLEPPGSVGGATGTGERQFVTLVLGDQLCGISVFSVRDVLGEQVITRVPLAPREVAGSFNLRGRILTAIDLRLRLGLPPAAPGTRRMSLVVEEAGELYALLVDQVAAVIRLKAGGLQRNPPTLPSPLAEFSGGIYRLEDRLMVVLVIGRLLALSDAGRH